MKKITFLILIFAPLCLLSQTTFDISWQIGSNGPPASPTIETGDTVRWTWNDTAAHSVTSQTGSQETFDSTIISGIGTQFSYTFMQAGTNPYRCVVHPNSMFGTVTVTDVLSVDDKFVKNVKFYPNPVTDQLTIFSLYKLDSYKVYNVIGALVSEGNGSGNYTYLNMSRLNSGMYFIKVKSGDKQSTFKITKL